MNRKKAVQHMLRLAAGTLMFAMLSASAVAADAFSYDSPICLATGAVTERSWKTTA
ncbi:hypothetical protein E05_49990 [Plautia stali symbiont]|nr:hypothetical protein E05_49990 [Plautia stali symbiont]